MGKDKRQRTPEEERSAERWGFFFIAVALWGVPLSIWLWRWAL